jgi:hypothetical protein
MSSARGMSQPINASGRRLSVCFTLALVAVGLVACDELGSGEADATANPYASLGERLSESDLDRWITARADLRKDFADVCGDTFCGGDYSNLTTVALDCSATKAGTVNQCTWVIAGSIEYVDGATGAITVDPRVFACPIPVHTKTTAFLDALGPVATGQEGHAIRATIPGTGASFYDALAQCFANVVGGPPPPSTGTEYRELVEHLNEQGDFLPWWQARRRLVDAFDDACGDTFCEGDYGDISALGLACAVDEAHGTVPSCTWTFAGSYFTITTKGRVSAHDRTWSCPIAIDARVDALVATLSGDDPLHTALPGKTTSLMDALVDCL